MHDLVQEPPPWKATNWERVINAEPEEPGAAVTLARLSPKHPVLRRRCLSEGIRLSPGCYGPLQRVELGCH